MRRFLRYAALVGDATKGLLRQGYIDTSSAKYSTLRSR